MHKNTKHESKSLRKRKPRLGKSVQHTSYFPANTHNLLGEHLKLFSEQKRGADLNAMISFSRSALRRGIGQSELLIATGSRTGIATNAASVMIFSLPTGQGINMNLSTTTFPEITTIAALFDEVKVAGIHVEYNSLNPYNRGVGVQSNPICLFFDDEDGTLAPTNTLAGMGALVNRGVQYLEFCPDHSFKHTFTRMAPLSQYDWTPTSNLGSEPSTFGSLYVSGDGTNTLNNLYGVMSYRALLHVRMRN
jgi:hypothetical protein